MHRMFGIWGSLHKARVSRSHIPFPLLTSFLFSFLLPLPPGACSELVCVQHPPPAPCWSTAPSPWGQQQGKEPSLPFCQTHGMHSKQPLPPWSQQGAEWTSLPTSLGSVRAALGKEGDHEVIIHPKKQILIKDADIWARTLESYPSSLAVQASSTELQGVSKAPVTTSSSLQFLMFLYSSFNLRQKAASLKQRARVLSTPDVQSRVWALSMHFTWAEDI